ncbi:MAG: Hsp20/alpha crystallin family protein [bacterium]
MLKIAKATNKSVNDNENFFLTPHRGQSEVGASFVTEEGQLSCDIYHTKNNIVVRSTIAGVDPKNLDISVSNDLLTIRGFREMDNAVEEKDFFARELYWGTFSRSIVLPQEVDQEKTKASLKNGILTIVLPKKFKTTAIRVKRIED